jgi:large subunit ribosomal protein L21
MSAVAVDPDRTPIPKGPMYAVIETGGKQYRVEVGTELEVELLETAPGESFTIDRVLLVADGDEATIGRPVVGEAAVDAEVVRRERGDKVISFKYRPKARRRVKKGHRQELSVIRITDVRLNGKSAAEAKRKADADARSERQKLEEAAARQAAEDAALAERLAKASAKASSEASKGGTAKGGAASGAKAVAPKRGSAKGDGATSSTSTTKAAPKATTTKAASAGTRAPKAKTQSGSADAKPKAAPKEKPAAKPRATKKDE